MTQPNSTAQKFQKRDVPGPYNIVGDPVKIVVEIGPMQYHDKSEAEILRSQEKLRREIDRLARAVVSVGTRSKAVSTRIEVVDG